MSGRLGGGRSLFDELFSDFFDRSLAGRGGIARAQAPARRAESVVRFEVQKRAAPELLRERTEEKALEPAGSPA